MATSQQTELPLRVNDWTREQVYYWMTELIKVDKKYADKLYEEEVSGEELVCYELRHLQELGIKHGPAVKIITTLEKLKMKEQEARLDTTMENKDRVSTLQTKISKNTKESKRKPKTEFKMTNSMETITEFGKDSMDNIFQSGNPKEDSQPSDPSSASPSQNRDVPLSGTSVCTSSKETEPTESTDPKTSDINAYEVAEKDKQMRKYASLQHSCSLYPFDQNSASHRYIKNYTLPPETGPGNLIDPVHEYKFMGRTDDMNVIKKKFNKEVFRFAAGCMNSRTNGTIHFGVADSKDSQYAHAEIIGVSVDKKDTIIDHFNQGIKPYFEEHTDEAKACIRQPRFVEVLCSDSTLSGKYVIEVDVVPSHSIVQGKLFKIQTLDEDNQWKKSKGKSLFIRDGAATRDIYKISNPKDLHDELTRINEQINVLDDRRKEAEKRQESKGMSNQGEKLKNLLTCGGSRLDHYDYFIIVANKSHPEQLQHLQFMTTLKLFCVLDFDPNSVVNGSCHRYRDVRIANLHKPSQFHGDPGTIVKNLNLYKQTSWVFCNGRKDLNTETDGPLRPSEWLKHRAGEVQDMISFICNPDTLPRGRFLVIFLLLSTVEAMNDPIFDTFMSFYKNLVGSENTLSICTSDASFQKWRDYIQTRCEQDISQQSIYDLELSEINGTILKLGQNKQNAQRLLPSAEGSSVILQNKDEDLMMSLDILCENECENEFDESSAEFEEFKIKTESEFYRGGKVKWWNFYFSEQPAAKPFIKREKHSKLEHSIRSQIKDPKSTCVMLNLFHHPGCGGTTMAMHVMWNLRKEFRCAVLKDNIVSKEEVAQHVAHLIVCGKSEHSLKTPVLLLVEDSEETENTLELQHSLRQFTREMGAFVIILNCIRTKTPKDRHKKSVVQSEFITAELSDKEKLAFEMKLKELQEIKSFTTENFYSFMIMKTNFDPVYVENVATNILKDFRVESKQARLFCILALLNSYVAEPAVSRSLCEDFLGIKWAFWGRESVLDKMEPYSCLLIEFGAKEYGGFKAIRFVHQLLATECVKQLEENHNCSRADIVFDMLHCDAFFKTFAVKDVFVQSMKSMLITRQRKTCGDEKDTLFSPLIEDINSGEGGLNKTQEIFIAASERFEKDFTIPQALSRHLYLKERKFAEAKMWADSAKAIKENSYTVDTVGQVAKSELKHKLECKKQEKKPCTAEDMMEYLELASTATKAFRRAQSLAKTDDAQENEQELYRKLSPYNISGYMGEIDTAMTVFDIIRKLPLFENGDPMKDHYILQGYESFLTSLKSQVKEAFDFLEIYFTYLKEKGSDDMKDAKIRKWISEHYQHYISLFCSSVEDKQKEQKQKPTLSLNMEIEECRMFLEENRADTFPGLLQFLEHNKDTVQKIAEKYSFIYKNSPIKSTKDKTNHLLAHIILKLIWPKSKLSKSLEDLNELLKDILQDVGTQHPYPEPFYLAILLLWPGRNVNSTGIKMYVDKIRSSARKNLSHMYRTRTTIAHFFLGKSDGIQRLVTKVSLDRSEIIGSVKNRNMLWQTGEIFREIPINSKLLRVSGTIEQGEVFTEHGHLKIPVRPAFLGGVRSGFSTEKVSFYIGFAMDGPLAYDIQYKDDT
ncbi:sterile alpha motif domain-containing protein 9 isoform X2 [Megalobrama amblycephala]|uniref:sterile alpha motif domain-containing protein 9 isoform X2 n=1 Tax=Megalobrama amblycephala TaxID=75352 RepID=UPI00201428EB|nr:sterile alpha motif domain-containing protein 9 isoform X2 [Megalobrama amblycephala]